MRINLGKGSKKIHAAHGIPNLVAGKCVADQHRLQAGFAVLACRALGKRRAGLCGIGILQPLALANGIVGKHNKTVAGKDRGYGRIACFAAGSMAWTHDDRSALAVRSRAVGNMQQRGNEEFGLALKDYFADAKSIGLRFADTTLVWSGVR